MFGWVLSKIIGTQNEREIKGLKPLVEKINSFEPEVQKLSDAQLRLKTDEFRERLANGETQIGRASCRERVLRLV